KRATGKTVFILDEPTTGLHFKDIKLLVEVLNKLVHQGNTVMVIEHNLDVIKIVDYLIDLGPDDGKVGGNIIFEGTPEALIKQKKSITGKYLKEELRYIKQSQLFSMKYFLYVLGAFFILFSSSCGDDKECNSPVKTPLGIGFFQQINQEKASDSMLPALSFHPI